MHVDNLPMEKQSILEETKTNKQADRRSKFRKFMSNRFLEFSKSTSIHGFKYLGVGQSSSLEKTWWIIVLSICIYMCAYFTILTLKKREENPVFISFRQSPMHIWDVPFPAVTICPASKIKATKYNFTHYANQFEQNNLTGDERGHFMDVSMFCKPNYHCFFSTPPKLNHTLTEKSIDYYLKHAITVDDIFDYCKTLKQRYNCNELFSPLFTSAGLCFSFNMLDRTELFYDIISLPDNHVTHNRTLHWTADGNYEKTLNSTVPIRITSINDFFFFRLHSNESDVDKLCENNRGYRVILHHPAEVPPISQRYTLLSHDQNYKFWIKPNIITTSVDLKDYDPHKRGCYFAYEKKLKFFKIYTEPNCRLECVSNYTIKKCGCSLFYAPYEKNSRICGHKEIRCVLDVKEKLLAIEMKLEILEDDMDPKQQNLAEACDCLPSCTSIVYNAEIVPEQPSKSSDKGISFTAVYLTFKDASFITMERKELFSSADFWASCGGLFGLFTGFSVVSLAEIIYFSVFKWICNLWRLENMALRK